MGTRADFYIGKGKEAKWLGSIAWDGYAFNNAGRFILNEDVEKILKAKTEDEFLVEVSALLKAREDATLPEQGWPWPWEDSRTTDYAYSFFDGKARYAKYGRGWFDLEKKREQDFDQEEFENMGKVEFPTFSTENMTLGPRSGLIVLGMKTKQG